MLAMPLDVLGGGDPQKAFTLHRDDMLRALATFVSVRRNALLRGWVGWDRVRF
jgi:hypothetical protein